MTLDQLSETIKDVTTISTAETETANLFGLVSDYYSAAITYQMLTIPL